MWTDQAATTKNERLKRVLVKTLKLWSSYIYDMTIINAHLK